MPFPTSGRATAIGGNLPFPETGTPVAIYNSSKSARPLHAKHGFSTWGGARNRAGRTSDSLTLKQASGIIEAAQYACTIGLPLNRHVTIHLERAGVPDSQAAAAIGAFLRLVRDWLRKQNLRTAWVWVRENGDDKGSHVHILLHIPAGVRWSGWRSRRWLKHVTGKPHVKGIIKTTVIGGTLRAASLPDHYAANLLAVVSYGGKGTAPDIIAELNMTRAHKFGGCIIGKRCGWTQNVGAAQRQRAGSI